MKPEELTLWRALDAIEKLSYAMPCFVGTGDELVNVILDMTGTVISPKRRAWLIEELAGADARHIMFHRDVLFFCCGCEG